MGTQGASFEVHAAVVKDNTATEDGVLSIENYEVVDITNLQVLNCTTQSSSAGLAISGSGNVTIRSDRETPPAKRSKFRNNNMTNGEGTALQIIDCGSVDLEDVEFTGNEITQ